MYAIRSYYDQRTSERMADNLLRQLCNLYQLVHVNAGVDAHLLAEEGQVLGADENEWNDLIENPDVLVIDTRNHYEVEVGTLPRITSYNVCYTKLLRFPGRQGPERGLGRSDRLRVLPAWVAHGGQADRASGGLPLRAVARSHRGGPERRPLRVDCRGGHHRAAGSVVLCLPAMA